MTPPMTPAALVEDVFAAFAEYLTRQPVTTLRAGNALDDHRPPPPFDAVLDKVCDACLEQFSWGVSFLDPASWRHDPPYLIDHAVRQVSAGGYAVETMFASLRPPDRDPPRLATLNDEQEKAIAAALEMLAFSDESAHQESACQVLEEWWIPGAHYRSQP